MYLMGFWQVFARRTGSMDAPAVFHWTVPPRYQTAPGNRWIPRTKLGEITSLSFGCDVSSCVHCNSSSEMNTTSVFQGRNAADHLRSGGPATDEEPELRPAYGNRRSW